jgi:hypothetical protein
MLVTVNNVVLGSGVGRMRGTQIWVICLVELIFLFGSGLCP